jgi:hypothetical protein
MGTGIDLFLDWENGIWVAGTGIWPPGMGNEVLKNGNGIEVMRVDSQFFYVLSILKYNFDPFLVSLVMIFTALPANRHTLAPGIHGFSDYACLRMLQMPFLGFKFKNFRAAPPRYFIKCAPLSSVILAHLRPRLEKNSKKLKIVRCNN